MVNVVRKFLQRYFKVERYFNVYLVLGDELIIIIRFLLQGVFIMNEEYKRKESADLAIIKALIGITQLYALEEASKKINSSFLQAKAITTYYIVYHMFSSHIARFDKCKKIHREIKESILNSEGEKPEDWTNCANVEKDIACSIGHCDIKKYCKSQRKNEKPELKNSILTANFIGDNEGNASYLYEKLCYIRDRVVYRPTFVYDDNGKCFQTSKDIKKEIMSMPDSNALISILYKYCESIKFVSSEKSCHNEEKYWVSIGLSPEEVKLFKQEGLFDEDLNTYEFILQIAELETPEKVMELYKRFYVPFKDKFKRDR